MNKSTNTIDAKTAKTIRQELKLHARALDIPDGAAESFINEVLKSLEKSLKTKSTITSADLTRLIAKELKKYHQDLAYVYQNRDTII